MSLTLLNSESVRRAAASIAGATIVLAGASACATGPSDATVETADRVNTQVDANAFPVTITHALGETTIEQEPKRVVTLGWSDQDHVLDLGVVPVGATKISWGGNAAGSTDWFDDELKDEFPQAAEPARLDDTDGTPIDEVAALAPDLILATNSGITEADYKKLTKIAPVVAYPEAPWVTSWRDSLTMVGQALGRSTLAQESIAEIDAQLAEIKSENPVLAGTSAIFTNISAADLSQIYVYGEQDPRFALLLELGMVSPDVVAKTVPKGQFFGTISAERASTLDADVVLTYGETEADLATFANDKLVGQLPALKSGHTYLIVDKAAGLAAGNPSALSLDYYEDHFIPGLVAAIGDK